MPWVGSLHAAPPVITHVKFTTDTTTLVSLRGFWTYIAAASQIAQLASVAANLLSNAASNAATALPPASVIHSVWRTAQVASAVAASDALGLVHRDGAVLERDNIVTLGTGVACHTNQILPNGYLLHEQSCPTVSGAVHLPFSTASGATPHLCKLCQGCVSPLQRR